MARLEERVKLARRALTSLEALLDLGRPATPVERDAAIQRFEYTFEAAWKAARQYLREMEGLDVGSPKGVIRASLRVGLIDENMARLGLEMADDRNLTVHTYNEAVAEAIHGRLPEYAGLMRHWLEAMQARL